MTIKFAHIAPTETLSQFTKTNGVHLLLAHLVEEYPKYKNYYASLDDSKVKILDNSAFEFTKQGKPMMESSKLIDLALSVNADTIVMSDYPGEQGSKTIASANLAIPQIKAAGLKAFFVPQSRIGDCEDYINCFEWGLNNPDIDLLGLSILGAPNAFGVERDNRLQRYMSRFHVLNILKNRKILDPNLHAKKIHCLGMVDGPNEIDLLKAGGFEHYIYSWDSSAAVWAGINGIKFDNSPTGLLNGKFELEVDFRWDDNITNVCSSVQYNIDFINGKL
jgi:hypothetical protein